MAAAVATPFEYTATGILGDKRDSMLVNQLLLRDQLGRSKTRAYTNYPGLQFRYGRTNYMNPGAAYQAMSGWAGASGPPSNKALGDKSSSSEGPRTERDFISTNRAAAQAGVTTSAENARFRASHDIRRSIQTERGRSPAAPTRRLPASMTYGISTRPSTPINDLLEFRYQDKWLQSRRSDRNNSQDETTRKTTPNKVQENRASMLRSHQVAVDPAPYWHLPRFARTARPHLETFRSAEARDKAFRGFETDSAARLGRYSGGVYEAAKS